MSGQVKPLDAKSIGASTYRGRKAQTLLTAARHNLRYIQAETGASGCIDPARTCRNEIIYGPDTPGDVAALAKTLMDAAGVDVTKFRKDWTQAHELLFTLPPDTTIDVAAYFKRCLTWTGDQFGHENVLSATVHHDEGAPHLHILIVPLSAGQYAGSALIDRDRLKRLRALFAQQVAPEFGIVMQQPLTGARRAQAIVMVHERLKTTQDAILSSALWNVVKIDINRNPGHFMQALGIMDVPLDDGGKEFRRIALSPGKGSRRERVPKPSGFESAGFDATGNHSGFEIDAEKHRNPSSVGFAQSAPLQPAVKASQPTAPTAPLPPVQPAPQALDDVGVADSTVERDIDQDPSLHDPTTGEFFKRPPPPARHQRLAADAWVNSVLGAMQKKGAHHAI